MTPITGRTRLFGILGDPIVQAKTPEEMNALFAREGVDAVLAPLQVPAGGLGPVLAGLRGIGSFGGAVVTMPHKAAALALCDALEGDAALIGAVNVLRREADGRLVGAMLDGTGFVGGLQAAGIALAGMDACLLGAGGAGSAIAFALAGAGVARLTIVNRSALRARDLAARVAERYPGVDVQAGQPRTASRDLLVNATPLGMRAGDPLPLADLAFRPGQVVADAILDPVETPLLAAARAAGARIQPGRPMLQQQIRMMAQHMGAL